MKKFRILPLIAIATLTGITLPLVSCKKGGDEPEPEPIDPLCFTADGENSTIWYNAHDLSVGDDKEINIEVSTDSINWNNWELQDPESAFGKVLTIENGQRLYVRNTKNTLSHLNNCFQFEMTGKIAASGNVNSMINHSELTDYCFYYLFKDCDVLTTPPKLPAMTLAKSCYAYIFLGCSSLTSVPELPAETLAEKCYEGMFDSCTSLTTVPDKYLHATTLAPGCYRYMFNESSITRAPELPATTLSSGCYECMFRLCPSLTQIPELPTDTLVGRCYFWMFLGCERLKINNFYSGEGDKIVLDLSKFTELPGDDCVLYMFSGTGGSFTGTPTPGNTYYLEA